MILAVRSDSVVDVQGTLADQALHFEREADGFHALGGVPFGSDSVVARVVRSHMDGMVDTATVALPVRRRRLPGERLRVAPEFARPPDSLKERIRLESELVDGVRERAHETARLWLEPFERPRTSVITSGFGIPRIFNGVVRSRHYGVDFAGQWGAPVQAANRGVVALVADLYYSGTTVLIDHGAGLVTGYFHLSRVLVVPGDTVERGQLVGEVGASGRVTRSHLHWFAAYGGVTVNPLDLLRLDAGLEWREPGRAKARRTND
ncbi:MAG TPA: M23 family metallopeptidase [Gemmatimonadales bacterium]|nr:M23 family metallopeptidase [Gemmatimonadales bacterium]